MEPDPDEHVHPGSEFLQWSKEHEEGIKGQRPLASYTKFSEHARTLISGEKQCSLFCGGKKCKYCTDSHWTPEQMVITGLYSEWVTDNILAMARPSNSGIEKHKFIEQFQKHKIRTVINLQKAGEHADCGDGNDKSGFSYDPQKFMENKIFFYNFGWPDYGVAALSTILDIVKVIQFSLTEGKVAVHCHAGLGRTGVIIACYLVFTNRMTGSDAIHYVRSQRKGSIQTRGQMQCVQEFEQYLKPFRIVFASKTTDSHEFTLQQFLNRQKHILHGYEARKLKYVPKAIFGMLKSNAIITSSGVIYIVCEKLLQLAGKGKSLTKMHSSFARSVSEQSQISLMNASSSSELPRNNSKNSLQHMTNSHLKLTKGKSVSLEDLDNERLKTVLKDGNESDSSSSSKPSFTLPQNNGDIDSICSDSDFVLLSVKEVINALATNDISEDQADKSVNYEEALNKNDATWLELAHENDPKVLAQVMWDWLDHLKEPVLRMQDLNQILGYVEDPYTGLQKLERGTRYTIEYLLKVLSKLRPFDKEDEGAIFEKLFSYLTHCWVNFSDFPSGPASGTSSWAMSTRDTVDLEEHHWSNMKIQTALRLNSFFAGVQEKLFPVLEGNDK